MKGREQVRRINVLVLGVGGNVSQGILKAIVKSDIDCRIVGACVSSESLGLYFCDSAYICPYAESDEFMTWLIDVCNKESIDIVFTGVEENIIKIATHLEEFNTSTHAIFKCATIDQLLIGQNKLKTCDWLKKNDCNYPKYAVPGCMDEVNMLIEDVGYPLIAKPIKGKGSVGIIKINNENELSKVLKMEGYILQEYIGTEHTEHTVGCYGDRLGRNLDPIIMHRELKYGTTFKAVIIENEVIKAEVIKICEKFKPIGPLNIQLRLNKLNIPVCFELNVRFSGTTPMRAHFGFNDVEAMIKEYVLNEELAVKFEVKKGLSYRYMNEMYIEDDVQEMLKRDGFINEIKKYQIKTNTLGG